MAYRVAYNLSSSPKVVSGDGALLPARSYGPVNTLEPKVRRLLDAEPAVIRLLTDRELEQDDLPDDVTAAVEEVAARKKADADAAAARRAEQAKADADAQAAAAAPAGEPTLATPAKKTTAAKAAAATTTTGS